MKLKIFNLNTWLLPYPFSKHRKSRFKELVLTIKSLDPDIITLQEVVQKKHLKQLRLPGYFTSSPRFKLANKSGLVTLSKMRPSKTNFISFKKPRKIALAQKIAKRGVLITEFKEFVMYNTQLYPEGWNLEATNKEFNHLKKIVDRTKICFVSGDLNLKLKDFEDVNKGFFSFVEDTDNTFSRLNQYVVKWWDRNVTTNKKLDYILVKNPTNKRILFKSMAVKKPVISDHYGIFSEIEIR